MPCLQPAFGEGQTAHARDLLAIKIFGRNQHVKTFSHAGRSYQVLELQGDFGALLGQATVFEGVGELIGLSNSHQEL